MKTDWFQRSVVVLAVLGAAAALHASWNVSLDADARYNVIGWHEHDLAVKAVGASVRKTFADSKGDRVILFGLLEAKDNFSSVMLHELYGRYKGPLGKWNVTLGRFGIPFGLLSSFSSSRLLYETNHDAVLGFDADNGAMLSGVVRSLDYAVAVTQGLGAHHRLEFPGYGLGSGRVGFTLGDGAEVTVGLSGAVGKTAEEHMHGVVEMRALGGVDLTAYLGRVLARVELNGGMVGHERLLAGFAAADFAVHSRLDLNLAVSGIQRGEFITDAWFAGVSVKPKWLTIRGGYTYAHYNRPHHVVAIQLYRMFNLVF